MATTSFMLVNHSILPYNLYRDIISLKITFMLNNRMSFKSGITGTIHSNAGEDGSDIQIGTFSTNDFGVAEIRIPTNTLPNKDIDTCNIWAVGTYNGAQVNSVLARVNFIHHPNIEETIVNAGSCYLFPSDRSSYDLYDGGDFCPSGVTTRDVDYILDRGVYGC